MTLNKGPGLQRALTPKEEAYLERSARSLAGQKASKLFSSEELYTEALSSVASSIKTYDETKGTKFTSYAYNNMIYAILNYIAFNLDLRCASVIHTDIIPDREQIRSEKERLWEDVIRRYEMYFTKRDLRILLGRLVENKKLIDMSLELGISTGRISQLEKKALKMLKQLIKEAKEE